MRAVLRVKHYSQRTEKSYLQWARRFILFHQKRHPREMGSEEVRAFLSFLAIRQRVSASTQNQALNALVFLYKHVLNQELGSIDAARMRVKDLDFTAGRITVQDGKGFKERVTVLLESLAPELKKHFGQGKGLA